MSNLCRLFYQLNDDETCGGIDFDQIYENLGSDDVINVQETSLRGQIDTRFTFEDDLIQPIGADSKENRESYDYKIK